MKAAACVLLLVVACCGACVEVGGGDGRKVLVYRGASDASAGVAVGEDMFVVADDENNILRVYKTSGAETPVYSYSMTGFLDIDPDHPEADIEGATTLGRRIYWITSHGRNKDGKLRPSRYRFFATEIYTSGSGIKIQPVGRPCKTLVSRLIRSKTTRRLGLGKATSLGVLMLSKEQRKKLAPKREGLNIESLCASADGGIIYIGLRNPRFVDKAKGCTAAIVVPLKNPWQVVEKGALPDFGEPLLWDFQGLGIRAMEYSAVHKAYFIIAGSFDTSPVFALYRWSGEKDSSPVLVKQLSQTNFSPEALIPFSNSPRLLLLSDDGTLPISVGDASQCMKDELLADGTCPNKFLMDPNKKTFRAIWLEP